MFDDPYAVYVISAYGATAAILIWLLYATLTANAKARKALEDEQ